MIEVVITIDIHTKYSWFLDYYLFTIISTTSFIVIFLRSVLFFQNAYPF